MSICDAAPEKRGEELSDEKDRNEITGPQPNRSFRLAILLMPRFDEEAYHEHSPGANTYLPPS